MRQLTVACVPYLNSAMFYPGLAEEPEIVLTETSPRRLGELAEAGALDAGPMSLVDYFRLRQQFEPLGDYCVAVKTYGRSVLLFSQRPRLQLEGSSVAICNETSTAHRLLQLLFEARFHLHDVRCVPEAGQSDEVVARLVIGDRAMRELATLTARYPYLCDLAFEWWQWQLLPFVFSVWVVRRDLEATKKELLLQRLSVSFARGVRERSALVERRAADLGRTTEELVQYLDGFTFLLGTAERKSLESFETLLAKHRLLETDR